jgi:hypothetical protein
VSLPILEAEVYLETTRERLDRKVIAQAVKLIALPNNNPARRAVPSTLNVNRYISPLNATIAVSKERLKPRGSRVPTGNPPWIQAPWIDHSHRAVIKEKDQAIKEANTQPRGLFADASVSRRLAAIAVVRKAGTDMRVVKQESIGWTSTCGVLSAEIAAVASALEYAQEHTESPLQQRRLGLVVFTDS